MSIYLSKMASLSDLSQTFSCFDDFFNFVFLKKRLFVTFGHSWILLNPLERCMAIYVSKKDTFGTKETFLEGFFVFFRVFLLFFDFFWKSVKFFSDFRIFRILAILGSKMSYAADKKRVFLRFLFWQKK
jgi:hypothetical protein